MAIPTPRALDVSSTKHCSRWCVSTLNFPWLRAAHRTKSVSLHQCVRPFQPDFCPSFSLSPQSLPASPHFNLLWLRCPQASELFDFPGPLAKKLFLPHASIPFSTQISFSWKSFLSPPAASVLLPCSHSPWLPWFHPFIPVPWECWCTTPTVMPGGQEKAAGP